MDKLNYEQKSNIKKQLDIKDYDNKSKRIFINCINEYKKISELSNNTCIRCNINRAVCIKKYLNNINHDTYDHNVINTKNTNNEYKFIHELNNYDISHSYLLCKHQFCGICRNYGHNEIICKYLVEN